MCLAAEGATGAAACNPFLQPAVTPRAASAFYTSPWLVGQGPQFSPTIRLSPADTDLQPQAGAAPLTAAESGSGTGWEAEPRDLLNQLYPSFEKVMGNTCARELKEDKHILSQRTTSPTGCSSSESSN